jgi:hypothetical protein
MEDILKKIIGVLTLFLLLSIIQCAPNLQVVKEDEKVTLKRRAQEYWSYRIKAEWDKSYLFELPDYREKINISKYIQQNGRTLVKWVGFEILETWTSGEEGFVKLSAKYRYMIPMPQDGVFERISEEKWVKKDGQWYHLYL